MDRVRQDHASIVFAPRWTASRRVADLRRAAFEGRVAPSSVHGTVVRSPRGTGTFEFEPVPNALEDAGVRELASKDRAAALERIANGAVETFAPLITRPFDWARWSSDGIVGCAYTVVWGVQQGSSSPMVQRDWYLVLESDFANPHLVLASFRGNDPAAAPVDIFDCEEMVRTIRFET